jgi:DNA polymerase
MSTDDKKPQMKQVRDEVVNLTSSPLYEYRVKNGYHPVLGQGSHDARIMFIGEAPGKNEAEQGRPFCGASGRVLDEFLASVGLKRDEVYITNIVKDRPPENRDPTQAEIDLYAPFLERQINIIQPQVIATLGRYSMEYIMRMFGLGAEIEPISVAHGKKFEATTDFGTVAIVPLFHPAVALYNGSKKDILKHDFQVLKNLK